MAGTGNAPVGIALAVVSGGGQVDPTTTATLCSLHVGASERACRLTTIAFSDNGEAVAAEALGAVNPATGELTLTGSPELSVDITDNNRVDFTISAGPPANWLGWLRAEFTADYSI